MTSDPTTIQLALRLDLLTRALNVHLTVPFLTDAEFASLTEQATDLCHQLSTKCRGDDDRFDEVNRQAAAIVTGVVQ